MGLRILAICVSYSYAFIILPGNQGILLRARRILFEELWALEIPTQEVGNVGIMGDNNNGNGGDENEVEPGEDPNYMASD